MSLEEFLALLSSLSGEKVIRPHKYILLLAVMDLVQFPGQSNRFYFDEPLKSKFSKYLRIYGRESDRDRPYTPYFHLKSSSFWHLVPKPGRSSALDKLPSVGGPRELTDNVEYAFLSDSVYSLLADPNAADKVRQHIITILRSLPQAPGLEDGRRNRGIPESLFAHERKAIQDIYAGIAPSVRILNNLELLDAQSGTYYEYDIIILSGSGIYVVELKHWSGHIQLAPYNWVINESTFRTDPHRNNGYKCKVLKGICQHRFRTYPDFWVESVVVLTNPEAVVEGASRADLAAEKGTHSPTFASIPEFLAYLRKRAGLPGSAILSQQQVEAIYRHLESLSVPRRSVQYNIPGYQIVDYLVQTPEYIDMLARPVQGKARGLHRLRVFRLPNQASSDERKRLIKKAYNTVNAVSQMGDHPNIHKVWVFQNDSGDIIEASEWSETGTLRDLIVRSKGRVPQATSLALCRGIASALVRSHQAGVIHRSVKPEHILVMNGIPKLTDFDLSYQLEDDHVTVIPDASSLDDDGYAALEVLEGKDIDERTDFFGLGVIAYELLTGIKAFASVREFAARGGRLTKESLDRLDGISDRLRGVVEGMLVSRREDRLQDATAIIEAFEEGSTLASEHGESNPRLCPGDVYDVYEIVGLLGEGAQTQVYLAKTIRSASVVLKLFNREVPRERVLREFDVASSVRSSYVVRCQKIGYWRNDRYFLVLDHIAGQSMRRMIESGARPDNSTFRTVALCLMEAVEAFHTHRAEDGEPRPILHNDIKPDNILLTDDHKAVLIDCGIASEPGVGAYQGSTGYVPPDSIIGTDMRSSEDTDLFALGVSLYEWLFGAKPYDNPKIGDRPIVPDTADSGLGQFVPWLVSAIGTSADSRFGSASEMRQAFTRISETNEAALRASSVGVSENLVLTLASPRTVAYDDTTTGNPFVRYINSLSSASASNECATAESQMCSTYFDRISVPSPVVDYVHASLIARRQNVVLTGNAGDGKTTVAAEVIRRVTGGYHALRPREEIPSLNLVVVKDLSEVSASEGVKLFEEAVKADQKRYLIVTNTGTLLSLLANSGKHGAHVNAGDLLKALEADSPQTVLDGRFAVVNMGRTDSVDLACMVFQRILEEANWTPCEGCPSSQDCPILYNVRLIEDGLNIASQRVALLYKRLYHYGARLTMRQMTGHLAYGITAGRSCEQIRHMSLTALQDSSERGLFPNRFFGDDGDEMAAEAQQLVPVRLVRDAEFGVTLDPQFERTAWNEDAPTELGLPVRSRMLLQRLRIGRSLNSPSLRRQVRRLAFFFSPLVSCQQFIPTFLNSPMLLSMIKTCHESPAIPPVTEHTERLRILQVFQEHILGTRFPERGLPATSVFITRSHHGRPNTQQILAEVPADDFRLVLKTRYQLGDTNTRVLFLSYKGGADMELDLPFLDFVARRYEGEVAAELSRFYVDRLERFKVDLLRKTENGGDETLRLLRMDSGRTFRLMRMVISGNHLEVLE